LTSLEYCLPLLLSLHIHILYQEIKECDWLSQISDHRLSLSFLGLKGFLQLADFLVFQNLERSNSLLDYLGKRLLKILPRLAVVLILTVLLAFFVYQGNLTSYLKDKNMWTYVTNNLALYRIQYKIAGVIENNPNKEYINGPLWINSYGFTLYILLSFLYFFKS
jgi:peptidoglycan/LPS O-acetylase OafA/YrhL